MTYSPPVLLAPEHIVSGFSCGKPTLDSWIVGRAKGNQRSGTSRTWVVVDGDEAVIGYYASAAGSLIRQKATPRALRNQPEEIPAILLGRLAVHREHQGATLGPALLKHFIAKSLDVSEIIGVRLLLVHAIDEEARDFYLHFDFEASPVDNMTLMLLLSDVEAL